jgi:hypothetical protein
MRILSRQKKQVLSGLAVLMLGACGMEVPESYRGEFVEASTGLSLKLESKKGTLSNAAGVLREQAVRELKFDEILKAQSGIFMRAVPGDEKAFDVFMLSPKPETRKEGGGLVWMEAELQYGRFRSDIKEKVAQIQILQTQEALIQLDLVDKKWQIGWPPGALILNFVRKPESRTRSDRVVH